MAGGHYLDWANQPDPFRHYLGAPHVELSRTLTPIESNYFEVLRYSWSAHGDAISPPSTDYAPEDFLSNLLFYAMAISAWKQVRGSTNKWALRVNASSGNLHPTETHVVVRSIPGYAPGVYHYVVDEHKLELRKAGNQAEELWNLVSPGSGACPPVFLCLNSILWREIWKYRERGFRYCQHDMGHALGACLISATALGWRATVHGLFADADVASVLGVEDTDEKPGLVVGLYPDAGLVDCQNDNIISATKELTAAQGMPNPLSAEQIKYRIVDQVSDSTMYSPNDLVDIRQSKLLTTKVEFRHSSRPSSLVTTETEVAIAYDHQRSSALVVQRSASATIRQRRSAVDLDGQRRMNLDQLSAIISSSTRGFDADFQSIIGLNVPGDALTGHYLIDLYIYVHRVDGLKSGLYFFDRRKQILVPLLLTDQREVAKGTSCFQDIAADGCFSISMVADFELAYKLYSEKCYRLVHFEAGMIGQLLYLAATAIGFDATGIGCFIDDAINKYLALPAGQEVIYNFTIGGAVLDPRLTSLPAYDFPDPAIQE